MQNLTRPLIGSICMVLASATIGLFSNSLRSDGLPLVRRPLRETRAFVTESQLVHSSPKHLDKPNIIPSPSAQRHMKPVRQQPQEMCKTVKHPAVPAEKPTSQPAKPKISAQSPKPKAEALFTTVKDAKSFFDKKTALFVDARPREDYDAEHITGAVSLYCEQFDTLYDGVLGDVPKDRVIVTFCSDPECKEAVKLGDALVTRGHTKVVILLEGLPGWKNAGYPVTTGKESAQ